MTSRTVRTAIAGVLMGALTGCAGSSPRHSPNPCPQLGEPVEVTGPLTFLLGGEIDPDHAPEPHSPAEAVAFRHLYETPFRADCRGVTVPGLAVEAEENDDGRLWKIRLDESATFSDGSPLTAQDVRRSWLESRRRGEGSHWFWKQIRPRSVLVDGPHRLLLYLEDPLPHLPELLTHPAFAVVKRDPERRWPVGTRSVDVLFPEAAPASRLEFGDDHLVSFAIDPRADPRDLARSAADASLLRDREAQDYLALEGALVLDALPWSRLYLYVSREGLEIEISREELARDVARETAAPATSAFFESERDDRELDDFLIRVEEGKRDGRTKTPPAGRYAGKILHPERDEEGRRVAERLAFVKSTPESPVTVQGLPESEFRAALELGRATGFVLPIERRYPTAELQFRHLQSLVPWLVFEHQVEPLIRTRAWLARRPNVANVAIAYDGVPSLDGAGTTGTP